MTDDTSQGRRFAAANAKQVIVGIESRASIPGAVERFIIETLADTFERGIVAERRDATLPIPDPKWRTLLDDARHALNSPSLPSVRALRRSVSVIDYEDGAQRDRELSEIAATDMPHLGADLRAVQMTYPANPTSLLEAAKTLAAFAREAPGKLPERVEVAFRIVAEAVEDASDGNLRACSESSQPAPVPPAR